MKIIINIRKATSNDANKILTVLESGRVFLQSQGLSQWQDGYSPSRYVEKYIANNWGYVMISPGGIICGYAALAEGTEDCYNNIKGGSWDNTHEKYITIHSVAIDAEFRGKNLADPFMHGLIEIAAGMGYGDIRIDTHPANIIMQKVILRAGFVYRGMVRYNIPDGNRMGFQLIR
ncbi:MAG: GNAT family N-acetyltransferase [Clostridiales bacterium]|jgi:ribosomal protein S18 acetylase RimI-like enzyme|nr:GNAT family N-acetyltransferase [Clostridiales bacterium]